MKEDFKLIKELNENEIENILKKYENNNNLNLIYQLILVSIKNYILILFKENVYFKMDQIVLSIMEKLQNYTLKINNYFNNFKNELENLIYTLIKLQFPKIFEEFHNININEITFLSNKLFYSYQFCGLIKEIEKIIYFNVLNNCFNNIELFEDNFEESVVNSTIDLLNKQLILYEKKFPNFSQNIKEIKLKIYQKILFIRSNQIFDIITNFPDSKPSLIDLRDSLIQTNMHEELITISIEIFTKRLLHLGAGTSDIVIQYINTIQAFNIIDNSGSLTRLISPPIQKYLTTRNDLLFTIVSLILEDSNLIESKNFDYKTNDDDIIRDSKIQKEIDENWKPEPLHSHIRDLNSLISESSDSDALSLLINVYGSINSFVRQLEKEIAKRLENIPGYSFDAEVKAIELLKKRFGNQIFLNCEVILQDVFDSKRIQNKIENSILNPLIISHMYWPEMSIDTFKLPNIILNELNEFEKEFNKIKTQRKLEWIPTSGIVELEIQFNDGEILEITVTPLQASLIYLFNDIKIIDIDYIQKNLQINKSLIENLLTFWTMNGVLIKKNNSYLISLNKPLLSDIFNEEINFNQNKIEEEEEENELIIKKNKANKFAPFAKMVLASRPKEIFTIQSFYNLLIRFVRGNDFKITEEEFLKLIPIWIEENMIKVEGENVFLIKKN